MTRDSQSLAAEAAGGMDFECPPSLRLTGGERNSDGSGTVRPRHQPQI